MSWTEYLMEPATDRIKNREMTNNFHIYII
jgi:hypothetical protein